MYMLTQHVTCKNIGNICIVRRYFSKNAQSVLRIASVLGCSQSRRHYRDVPTDVDTAWSIALPYLEQSGLLPYLDVSKRRINTRIVFRPRRIHVLVRDHRIDVHIGPSARSFGPRTESPYIFDIPVMHELPTLEACKHSYCMAVRMPSNEQLFRDRAVDADIDPDLFIEHVRDISTHGETAVDISDVEMELIREYIALMRTTH